MNNFASMVAKKAQTEGLSDKNAEDWAARAFATLMLMGGMDEITDDGEVGPFLIDLLSLVPDSVLLNGTMNILAAQQKARSL